jgi:hypothetical protein
MAQDAFSAFEQIMKTQDQNRSAERTSAARPQDKESAGNAQSSHEEEGSGGAVPPETTE